MGHREEAKEGAITPRWKVLLSGGPGGGTADRASPQQDK